MEAIRFDWDNSKANENFKKHKVSFIEAKTVFIDQNARLIFDPDHSNNEDRFILLGVSSSLRLIAVCHCYRENSKTIRIISARKATKNEKNQYYRRISL